MTLFEWILVCVGIWIVSAGVHFMVLGFPGREKQVTKKGRKRMDKLVCKRSKSGEPYWCIEASNGQCLAVSEMYSTDQACLDTVVNLAERINSCKDCIRIVDKTGGNEG